MPIAGSKLGSELINLGELIGILTSDGQFNEKWFSQAGSQVEGIPKRLPQLLQLIDDVLGPAIKDGPPVFVGAQWYSIKNPSGGTPTNFYLVTPPRSASSGVIGVGVLHTFTHEDLTMTAYGYVPLFQLSASADPSFMLDKEPSHLTLVASASKPFTVGTVTFTAMQFDADIYFADQPPSMKLVFQNLKGNGSTPATYASLSELLKNIKTVGDWIATVILQGTTWLNTNLGDSIVTVGDILQVACILTTTKGQYILNETYLTTNLTKPEIFAENFLFNLLNLLANSSKPLVPIPGGAPGSGIYILKNAAKSGADYGIRVMIQDIKVGGASTSKPEFLVQLGKWVAKEQDADSWMVRSLGTKFTPSPPGISIFLFNSTSTKTDCSSTGPSLTFAPRVELISLGIDVNGSDHQPLFNLSGYTLGSAELRVSVNQNGTNVTFGTAAALEGLGVPLGPGFGNAVSGSHTNPVAQSLLESGKGTGGKAEKSGDHDPVNPSFSLSAAYVENGSFVVQLYDQDGNPAKQVILPIHRSLGPLQCEKLGIGWVQNTTDSSKDQLSLLFDGGIKLSALDIDLKGLTVGIPITTPNDFAQYDLSLDGLGITMKEGQVELSAALVKLPPDPKATPPRTYTEYNGEALLKADTFAISALGSYAYIPSAGSGKGGYASLFIFGLLDAELGGPGFFFVTGLAAGFGYNRGLILPGQNNVPTFPLVAGASNPSALGATKQPDGTWKMPDPATALSKLEQFVPPERGEYWLAAGVRFTSFDLINSTALLVVEFGHELEIGILGLSWMSLPPPAGPGASAPVERYAYAELGIEIKLLPSEGVFSASAILTQNSFVLDPACKLTGGFAFDVWFGDNPHAGEFVLTLGGYHPDFQAPSYFPKVPRLGFNWPMPNNVTISGNAYFALTSSAVMAGGGLEVLYHSGNLKAWFKAQMDALIVWAPFHFIIGISISMGVSYRIHIWFITKTLKIELGADLTVWGPKMGGKVHVHLFIVSFTVNFGASRSDAPPPLEWANDDGTGFAQTLLPHKATNSQTASMGAAATASTGGVQPSGLYTIAVNDGLLKTYAKGTETIWIVRPNHFVFSTVTAIPTTQVEIAPVSTATTFMPQTACHATSDYVVYLRPMNVTLASSVFTITMNSVDTGKEYDLAGNFEFDFSCKSVPAAKFGKPLASGEDPEPNALLTNRLLGLENITPKAPTLTPGGDMILDVDVATAFTYFVIDSVAPYSPKHLPLQTGSTPVGPVPQVDKNALTEIKTTLMAGSVVDTRNAVFSALLQYGIDPVTNGTLNTFANDPAAVLNGDPYILESTS